MKQKQKTTIAIFLLTGLCEKAQIAKFKKWIDFKN